METRGSDKIYQTISELSADISYVHEETTLGDICETGREIFVSNLWGRKYNRAKETNDEIKFNLNLTTSKKSRERRVKNGKKG